VSNGKRYSIQQAAAELGMTRQAVHTAILQKRLRARHGTFEVQRTFKVKGWMIDEADLREFQVSLQHQEAGKKNE